MWYTPTLNLRDDVIIFGFNQLAWLVCSQAFCCLLKSARAQAVRALARLFIKKKKNNNKNKKNRLVHLAISFIRDSKLRERRCCENGGKIEKSQFLQGFSAILLLSSKNASSYPGLVLTN